LAEAEHESPYAPPQAELVGSDALQDGETWTYPLRFSGTFGFFPRQELRDAQRRLLWLGVLKPFQLGVPFQTKRAGRIVTFDARLGSVWHQRWEFRDPETREPLAALRRIGGCLPGAFVFWPAWIGEGDAGVRLVLRARGPSIGRWVLRPQPQPPLARSGLQNPDALGREDSKENQWRARLTLHASESAPAFLRVRQERGALKRSFVIERLEGEVPEGVERFAQQVLVLVLGMGLG